MAFSTEITEVIYGSQSIELANELHKYSDVLFHARKWETLKTVVKRAREIFIINYGEGHDAVGTLGELEELMNEMTL